MKELVKKRDIQLVVHFTRLKNLKSILEHGLKSRIFLEDNKSDATFNDQYRHDGCKEAICCSITHPNYKMFYKYRQENPEEEWVVLGIKKRIIWKKDCAFSVENAASNNVTKIPIDDRKGKKAFKKLFKEDSSKPTREKLGIADSYPTNPQAEILVFDDISPKDIFGVVFQTNDRVEEYEKLYDGYEFITHDYYFSYREDYENW